MKKSLILTAVFFLMTSLLGIASSNAQENERRSQSDPSKTSIQQDKSSADQGGKPIQPYRLDFSFSELEDGKKVNSRHYSMSLTAGSANEMKIGSRVPVAVGEGERIPPQYQYLDLGTNLWANLRQSGEDLQLEIRSEISWTKHEDVDVAPRAPHTAFTPPVVSQIKINGSTLLQTGKPMIIGMADDPYSNRQFQLEVTATKLR